LKSRTRLKVAALFLLAALSAAGQLRESVTVEVIQVPVYVSAADGTPIRNLPRDAFRLFVDRKEQPIDYFDVVDFAAGVEPRHDLRQRRLFLLLFDRCFSQPGSVARAQRAVASLVESSNPSTDYFAVANYTANKGVQFVSAFLNDRAAVRRAIDTLALGELHDPLGVGVSAAERSTWLDASGAAAQAMPDLDMGPGVTGGEGRLMGSNADLATAEIAAAIKGGESNQDNLRQPLLRAIGDQVDNLADVAARLTALEGQKHVVFFSQGFNGAVLNEGSSGMVARSTAGASDRTVNLLQSMIHVFERAGVILDTVDIASSNAESLQILAHGTGGEFVRYQNDLAAGIRTLATRQEVVYLLGIRRRDVRRGKIDVRVSGLPAGAHVTFRQGFGPPAEHGEVDPLQLADILLNDIPQTGLRVGTRFNPSPGGAELEFALWPKEIAPQLVEKTPYVDAMLYVFDAAGATVFVSSKRVTFDDKLRASDAPVILRENLKAKPGKYVAKAVVRIAGTESLGFARRELTVE
jgi:VWFA-related protein